MRTRWFAVFCALVTTVAAPTLAVAGSRPAPSAGAPALVQTLPLEVGSSRAVQSHQATQSAPEGPFCSPVRRATEDRPDLHEGHLVHVIYLVASDAADESLDTNGTLACSIQTQNEWLRKQTGLEWRWDTALVDTTDPADLNRRVETLDVTFVRSTQPADALTSGTQVKADLTLRGFKSAGKRYLTYVVGGDDSGVCGDAFYPLTQSPPEADGQYAQVYLESVEGCGARDFGSPDAGGGLSEAIAQQELMHNDSMTPIGAPHTCTNGIPYAHLCTGPLFVLPQIDPEGRDVMFPYVYYPLRDKLVDRGHDDYFGHSLPIGSLEDSTYLQPANAWGPPIVQPRTASSEEPTASPSSAPTSSETRTIEARASRAHVHPGAKVEISGRLQASDRCSSNQTVSLRGKVTRSGAPIKERSTSTGDSGGFSFRVAVRRSTTYTVHVDATDVCAAADSDPIQVRVRP